MAKNILRKGFLFVVSFLLIQCSYAFILNYPHPTDYKAKNVLYTTFVERPKHLDPARSYASDENVILSQIYEPLYQYHYLLRPYKLIPLIARKVSKPIYYDGQHNIVNKNKAKYSVYIIHLQPHIFFALHPAFAKKNNKFIYHNLTPNSVIELQSPNDLPNKDTRECLASDYLYQIKRLADPKLSSPIFNLMSEYIVGLKQLHTNLSRARNIYKDQFIDLRKYNLSGVKAIDDYTLQITIKGVYRQFNYWLAMTFFSPVAWEVDKFYNQSVLQSKNITLDWYPVGTGPYILQENNPNLRIILQRNTNFHGEKYPTEGMLEDKASGLLRDAGKSIPFIDTVYMSLEKESIPRWNKFMQGYYDLSSVDRHSFNQSITINPSGNADLTHNLRQKNVHLNHSVQPSVFYWGFNMLDPIVGGYNEKSRDLRQAIVKIFNLLEYIAIFLNGQGVIANSPIPVGIFGHQENNVISDNNESLQNSLKQAKKLLIKAGYENGINPQTQKPLIINFDTVMNGSDNSALSYWMRKQFAKLGIELNIRSTTYNRFQEKLRLGDTQFFKMGWIADYPDAENFLFLLTCKQSKVNFGGENATNYCNKEYDQLFNRMRNMDNNQQREKIIQQMIAILQKDSPWIFGFYPTIFTLSHKWMGPYKIKPIGRNSIKYRRLNYKLRQIEQYKWNKPVWQPLLWIILIIIVLILPVLVVYYKKQHLPQDRVD